MKPPPDHLAATVEVPVNKSSTAMRLVPAVLGLPWVADQEIMVWVASCGWKLPALMPQSVCGGLAVETSASTGVHEPWRSITASCGGGWPVKWTGRAARARTHRAL